MKRVKLVRDKVELKPTNDGYAVLKLERTYRFPEEYCEVMRKAIETINPARVALDLDNIIRSNREGIE